MKIEFKELEEYSHSVVAELKGKTILDMHSIRDNRRKYDNLHIKFTDGTEIDLYTKDDYLRFSSIKKTKEIEKEMENKEDGLIKQSSIDLLLSDGKKIIIGDLTREQKNEVVRMVEAFRKLNKQEKTKIIKAPKHNLEWLVMPKRELKGGCTSLTFQECKEWIDGLGAGWRFPTIEELDTLYDVEINAMRRIDREFKLANDSYWKSVWTDIASDGNSDVVNENERESYKTYDFCFGNEAFEKANRPHRTIAFAVRDTDSKHIKATVNKVIDEKLGDSKIYKEESVEERIDRLEKKVELLQKLHFKFAPRWRKDGGPVLEEEEVEILLW